MPASVRIAAAALAAVALHTGGPALAQAPAQPAPLVACVQPGEFSTFVQAFRRYAAANGITEATLNTAFAGVAYSQRVISFDRGQRATFRQTFEEFSARMINQNRLNRGAQMLRTHAATLTRIEQQFGVPAPVVVAIWGLETDYGANQGSSPVMPAVASLASDCRRPGMFQRELMAALRIIQRGDLTPAEMRGALHGEIGQTQFLPSSYWEFAVDFDGNGKRDLIRSVPDVLASTANYLRGKGWQRGQPWGEGTRNFDVLREWNRASIYQRTIALFATRLQERAP
jgi:lytic murein transglycosylase